MVRISNISFFRFLLEKWKIRLADVCKDLSCNCLFELLPLTFIHYIEMRRHLLLNKEKRLPFLLNKQLRYGYYTTKTLRFAY